ncbi:hypothetical protein GMORB2_3265 [Geosmithia morbida]|uniref:DUF3669 domain-containing protein n=1 Tax=Geosmithia morbida TaxID=1094350 RepID=A0A9P5CY92_9HYPO|nr:uncharacterized protein GMORB2_3265 [Geosmithia morbida]KAF4120138.1 hypothetical protein GMORB2_3265 [Geosmithia morbida]
MTQSRKITKQYRGIGCGTFGVVFAMEGDDMAVKKTFKSRDTLTAEFECGVAFHFATTVTKPVLGLEFPEKVPRVPWYQSTHAMQSMPAQDPWWVANRHRLPSTNGDSVPNGVFLFQRIPPVPPRLQESIVCQFWKTVEAQDVALKDDENKDCMIRPYLQERWVDMTDVEFVIAGRQGDHDNGSCAGLPEGTQLWLVDFDKCNRVRIWDDTLSRDIRELALGICANDAYYPTPLLDTRFGWDVYIAFADAYIRAGRCLLRHAFEKVATTDEQLEMVLQRPAMVMKKWTKIFIDSKKNNERELFDTRTRIRKEKGWEMPAWCTNKMGMAV